MDYSGRLYPFVQRRRLCAARNRSVVNTLRTNPHKGKEDQTSPYELGREFFERNFRAKPTRDVARHTKRLLIEHFRGKRK